MEKQRRKETVGYKCKLEKNEAPSTCYIEGQYRAERCNNRSGSKGIGNKIPRLPYVH